MPDVGDPRPAVLVAEDNPVNQRVAAIMLEHLGYQVDIEVDGAGAVRAATHGTYQAILMDCQLPILDGYEATCEIRRHEGASRRVPIVAVTASMTETDRERCLAAGMNDCLVKPLTVEALAAVIARWAPDDPAPADPSAIVDGDLSAPTEPGRPVLDPVVLARLARLGEAAGEDLLARLAGLFLADADARVGALREAVAAGAATNAGLVAHTLGGASANVGATHLASLCATLAAAGAADDLAGCGALVDAVADELAAVRSALRPPEPVAAPNP